jgi:PTH2 family peptidyl-tRNA hydrolase
VTEQTGNNKPNEAEGLAFPLSGNKKLIEEEGRMRIWVNSDTGMSRGKYAAAAVHAALTAAGVHPGVPVIVLGGQRDHIERMRTVIRDAGRTEVEPGTTTAGTDYVFEKALTPTDDERKMQDVAARMCGCGSCKEWLAESVRRASEVPEPSAEGYAEFEDWEQEMFRHQPVLSMRDGSIAGCQCLDRVFVKGREDWGTHLATIITSRLTAEPQGEPSNRVIVMCARCGLFPVVAGDEISSDIVVCDRCAFAEGRESVHGEPSGAELLAALYAYEAKAREQDNFPAMAAPRDLTWFSGASVERMRAALRAAGATHD